MAGIQLMDEKIDLFSNALAGNGHANTCDNFINSFPHPMDLSDVEVGVKQISLPTSWNPIPHTDRDAARLCWIVTYNKGVSMFPSHTKMILGPYTQWVGDGHRSLLFTLNVGVYDTAKAIVQQMKQQTTTAFGTLQDHPIWFHKTYDSNSERILLKSVKGEACMFANNRLCQALHYAQQDPDGALIPKYVALLYPAGYTNRDGIMIKESDLPNYILPSTLNDVFRPLGKLADGSQQIITEENAIHLDHKPDLGLDPTNQIQRFFFYANFVQSRIVNGVKQPLLASVHNPGLDVKKTTLTHTIKYPIPQYIPTNLMTLQHLHVWLQDEHGQPLSFTWGSVHILLHFRRRQRQGDWDLHQTL